MKLVAQESDFKIQKLNQKIIDNIDNKEILQSILTPLELTLLEFLKTPQTTKALRDFIIIDKSIDEHVGIYERKFDTSTGKALTEWRASMNQESIKTMEKELKLKDNRIKIPSYKKIDNVLYSLSRLGLVGKRSDPLYKGKHLWILSPQFLLLRKSIGDDFKPAHSVMDEKANKRMKERKEAEQKAVSLPSKVKKFLNTEVS